MAQTHPVQLAIVVDDGSTDATPAILDQYRSRWPALRVVQTEKRGLPHARNAGIKLCRSPFIAFLDSDDLWVARKLECQMALFSKLGPEVGFVHCGYYCIDDNGRRIERTIISPRRRGDIFRDLLVEGNIVSGSGSAVIAQRTLLQRVGGFDERLSFGEDWDLWIRLAAVSAVDFIPAPLVAIRVHDASMQADGDEERKRRQLFQLLAIVDRWYGTERFPPEMRRRYRHKVASYALSAIKGRRRYVLRFAVNFFRSVDLFFDLRRCGGRFGRDLFSGPFDFLGEVARISLKALVRRARGSGHVPLPQGTQGA